MNPDLVSTIATVDPEAIGAKLLGYVVQALSARGGVVLALQYGRVRLFADQVNGDLDRVNEATLTWQKRQEELGRGVAVQCGMAGSLSPLLLEGSLVGAVYLDGVPVSRCDIREIAAWLVAAIMAPSSKRGAVEDMVRTTSVEDFERQRIYQLLSGNEWNVARVARIMRTTRATIYRKMEEYGIVRQRRPRGGGAAATA